MTLQDEQHLDLIGAMYSDGKRLWEVIGYDGTTLQVHGGHAWVIADARDDLRLSPRDRPSRRVTANELDGMKRMGMGDVLCP